MEGILGCDALEGCADSLKEGLRSAGFGCSEEFFDFAPHFFDGIEVGGVGRQKADLRACVFDQLKRWGVFMRREIVQNDDVARLQRGAEDVLDVGAKDFRSGRAFDGHASGLSVAANG